MNKFTKLLSVFVIAGAVGAGVAGLAGCGEKPHEHSATKHEATAATCTADGNVEYYTCDGADCAGKYFSDEACTQEITNITVSATGHTEKFTDKGNGTHGITCEHGDLTETTEAHVDADQDGKCDKCEATVLVVGKYYNLEAYSSIEEIEIKADGKIVYNDNEYTISVADDGKATFEVNGAEYTLTKTASGYKIGNTYYGKKPTEEIVTDPDAFIGTYTGELVYSDEYGTYKVTKFSITDGYQVLFTQIKTGDKDGNAEQGVTYYSATTVFDGLYEELTNNDFETYYYHFVAQSLENDAVKTVNLIYEGAASLFTKVSDETNEIVDELPLDNYTYYVDAENDYSLTAYESYGTKIYEINGNNFRYKMEDADGNYIVTFTDSNFNDASCMLKISTDKSSIEVYTEDGATKLATLTSTAIEYPTIKVDGTANNDAVVDPFNSTYAYYKIETAGWYKITAGDDDITIYTEVDFDSHTVDWTSVAAVKAGKSKAIELAANSYIAVSSSYIANGFTAVYSVEEPEPDYEAFTNGKCEIADFDVKETYYVKGTVATAGKYYVTVDCTKVMTDMGAYFEIGGTKYGYTYDSSTWKWSQAAGELVCELDLAADATVIVKVGCDNQYASLGNVIVSLETEAEYTARLAVETAAPTFSGDQLGNYHAGSDKYTVAADGISLNDNALTFVKQKNGVYYYASSTKTYAISFKADGSLSVTTGSSNTTANKPVEVTFTTEQQGTYSATVGSGWYAETYTFIIDEDSVTLEYFGAEILLCTGYDTATGVYTYQDSYSNEITFKFDNDGNLEVTYGYNEFTAEKQASSGGEESTEAKVGENTVQAGKGGSVDIEFSVAGTYTITYDGDADNVYRIEVDGVTVANGGKFTVTDSVTITLYANSNAEESKFTIAVAQAEEGGEEGGETGTTFAGFTADQQGTYNYSGVMKLSYVIGTNTISTDFYGPFVLSFASYENGEYAFTGSDDYGTYTFVFKFDESGNMNIITDTMHDMNGYTATKA